MAAELIAALVAAISSLAQHIVRLYDREQERASLQEATRLRLSLDSCQREHLSSSTTTSALQGENAVLWKVVATLLIVILWQVLALSVCLCRSRTVALQSTSHPSSNILQHAEPTPALNIVEVKSEPSELDPSFAAFRREGPEKLALTPSAKRKWRLER